jgi:hypothetical protein
MKKLEKKYRDRFTVLADWIDKSRRARHKFFKYSLWFNDANRHSVREALRHPCGTMGCIGGWAVVFRAADEGFEEICAEGIGGVSGESEKYAAEWLGLTASEAEILFYGHWHLLELDAPVKDIVAMLRKVARTGYPPKPLA